MYAFAPEKPLGLVGRNFCLAILSIFASASASIFSINIISRPWGAVKVDGRGEAKEAGDH